MTGNTDKIRSLFLTALMVVSVFAGATAFAGSSVAASDDPASSVSEGPVEFEAGGTHYVEVVFGNTVNNSNYNYTVLDRNGNPVAENIPDEGSNNTRKVNLSVGTDNLKGAATLVVNNTTSEFKKEFDVTTTSKTISKQSSATAYAGSKVAIVADGTGKDYEVKGKSSDYFRSLNTGANSQVAVLNTGDLSSEVDYYVNITDDTNSQTPGIRQLGLDVSADNVTTAKNVSATVTAFQSGRNVDVKLFKNGDQVGDTKNHDLSSDASYDFDLGSVDAGTYTVEVTDIETGITAETQVTVTKAAAGTASFNRDFYSVPRGDISQITVNLENSNQGTLEIGTQSEDFFQVNATLHDKNDDGKVTVYFNTYKTTADSPNAFLYTGANSDDQVTFEEETKSDFLEQPLAKNTGEGYEMRSYVGPSEEDAENVAVTSLTVMGRETTGAKTWIAPANVKMDSVSTLTDGLTQRGNVAKGDKVIVQVEASGIYGALAEANGLEDQSNMTLTAVETGSNVEANTDADTLTAKNFTLMTDGENKTFYAVLDSSQVSNADTEGKGLGEWEATFEVYKNYSLVSDNQTVSTTFTVEKPSVSLNDGNDVTVPQGETSINGETNLAPGTDLNVLVKSTGIFRKDLSATVGSDGTFSKTVDFSDYEDGTEFSAFVRGYQSDTKVSGSIDADMNQGTTTTTSTTSTTSTTTSTTSTTSEDPSETSTTSSTTSTTSSDGQPGFGVAVALVALMAAALLALRREN